MYNILPLFSILIYIDRYTYKEQYKIISKYLISEKRDSRNKYVIYSS